MDVALKQTLDGLYKKYNHKRFIPPDPLQFIYKYKNKRDRELVGFFSAALAYGRVEQIQKSLKDLFGRMGDDPYDFVVGYDSAARRKLKGFKHRFNTAEDVSDLIYIFKKVIKDYGSLENLYRQGYCDMDNNIVNSLEKFVNALKRYHGREVSRGLNYFLCNTSAGSPCKRLNLFLRWMIRDDNVDPGLWKSFDSSKLIYPVDVHIARLTRFLGMHGKKNMSLKTAIEITNAFSRLNPDDPVKYDFALSRIGILEDCDGKYRPECKDCHIFKFCLIAKS